MWQHIFAKNKKQEAFHIIPISSSSCGRGMQRLLQNLFIPKQMNIENMVSPVLLYNNTGHRFEQRGSLILFFMHFSMFLYI